MDEIKNQETPQSTSVEEPIPHAATVEENNNFLYLLVLIFEVLCLSTLILLVCWGQVYFGGYAWDGTGLMFNWHPLLMVIGMIILYGNGMTTTID